MIIVVFSYLFILRYVFVTFNYLFACTFSKVHGGCGHCPGHLNQCGMVGLCSHPVFPFNTHRLRHRQPERRQRQNPCGSYHVLIDCTSAVQPEFVRNRCPDTGSHFFIQLHSRRHQYGCCARLRAYDNADVTGRCPR